MPLFIDYHQLEGDLTIDDVREAHKADLAHQEEYGVQFIQFWVNEKAAMVFCLIESPSAEACVECHLTSHGNTPCNIQQVEPGFLKLFMGEHLPIDQHHMTLTHEGEADIGLRTFLAIDIRTYSFLSKENQAFTSLSKTNKAILNFISEQQGRFVEQATEDSIVAVFNSSIQAIRCARSIQNHIQKLKSAQNGNGVQPIEYRFALNSGQPLSRNEGFFLKTIQQAKSLSRVATPMQMVLSATLKPLVEMEIDDLMYSSASIKVLTKPEEEFVSELLELIDQHLDDESFNVSILSRLIGVSRTHLYRKITALTEKSPQVLIKDLRMKKAWNLLKSKEGNITEVAFEVGYSNPSYFSKIFHQSFGYRPSELASNTQ